MKLTELVVFVISTSIKGIKEVDCYEVLQSRHQIYQFSYYQAKVLQFWGSTGILQNNASLIHAQAVLSLVQLM